jgi:pimeloyl-ACP methyl ester carboxylesterase
MRTSLLLKALGIILVGLTASNGASAFGEWIRHDSRNRGVIIFVHGVTGDGRGTWTSAVSHAYWPEMLKHDSTFDGQNIYVYSYESPLNDVALTIDQLASNLRSALVADEVLSEDQLTFVSHSMGGIITRGFILRYRGDVASKIRLLYFFATPTDGSDFANITALSHNPQFGQMVSVKPEGPRFLENQRDDWQAAKFAFPSYCAYENKPMFARIFVVSETSATYLCGTNRAINENHITIVKPVDHNSDSYRALKEAFVETRSLPRSEQGKIADSVGPAPAKPQPYATAPASPKEASLAGRTFKLSDEIKKFRARQKIMVPRTIEDKQTFQDSKAEYHRTFDRRVRDIVAELESCNVDTSKVKSEMATIDGGLSLANIDFVADSLEAAGNAIPEGQPKCGTGQPKQGFGVQQNGLYMLDLGQSTRGEYGRNLEGGREKAAATRIGDYGSSISMYLRDGLLCVDATIFSGPHIPLIEVVCNRARINAPGWDTNFSDKAMEVVDQNRSPMFQIIFVNPRRVQVNGIIPSAMNQFNIYLPGGFQKIAIDPSHPSPIADPIKTIFKYPAWQHQGEFAN